MQQNLSPPLLLITYFDSLYMSQNKKGGGDTRKERRGTSELLARKVYEFFSLAVLFPLFQPPLPPLPLRFATVPSALEMKRESF